MGTVDHAISKAAEASSNPATLFANSEAGHPSSEAGVARPTPGVSRGNCGKLRSVSDWPVLAGEEFHLGVYACCLRFADGDVGSVLQHHGSRTYKW